MSDRRLRELEREAQAGDEEAEVRLYELRLRFGLCTDCGLKLDRAGAVCWRCAIGEFADVPVALARLRRNKIHAAWIHATRLHGHVEVGENPHHTTICPLPDAIRHGQDGWVVNVGFGREVTCENCLVKLRALALDTMSDARVHVRNVLTNAVLDVPFDRRDEIPQ